MNLKDYFPVRAMPNSLGFCVGFCILDQTICKEVGNVYCSTEQEAWNFSYLMNKAYKAGVKDA